MVNMNNNTATQYHDIMRKAIRAYDLLDKEPKTVKEPIWNALVAGLELAQVYMMEVNPTLAKLTNQESSK